MNKDKVSNKFNSVLNEYRSLKRNIMRDSELEQKRRNKFIEQMPILFDIAHAQVYGMVKSKKIVRFLVDQRSTRVFSARDLEIIRRPVIQFTRKKKIQPEYLIKLYTNFQRLKHL
jgi:hypothetical protein